MPKLRYLDHTVTHFQDYRPESPTKAEDSPAPGLKETADKLRKIMQDEKTEKK